MIIDDEDSVGWMVLRWSFMGLLVLPFVLIFAVLAFTIWLAITLTGIGPLVQYILTRIDDATLDMDKLLARNSDLKILTVPGGLHSCTDGAPYKLCIRYTEPTTTNQKNYPPVVIPGALGVTLACNSKLHELLVEKGFRVLSFDRLGVGFSDDNPTRKPPSAADVAREMNFVMQSVDLPPETKWLAICPSMGHIVTAAFCCLFPNRLVGLVNVDGVPSPFIRDYIIFNRGGWFMRMNSYFVWTGSFRWFVTVMQRVYRSFESRAFDQELLKAQFNRSRFLHNCGLELLTIMSCCELATAALDDISLLKMPDEDVTILASAAPARSVIVDERPGGELRRETDVRSDSELGKEWVAAKDVDAVIAKVIEKKGLVVELDGDYINGVNPSQDKATEPEQSPETPLCTNRQGVIGDRAGGVRVTDQVHPLKPQWSNLVVRVLSMRSFRGGNSKTSYSIWALHWRVWMAAEQTMQTRLAIHGERVVYPMLMHVEGFMQTAEIANITEDVCHHLKLEKA